MDCAPLTLTRFNAEDVRVALDAEFQESAENALEAKIAITDAKFKIACDQIILLNNLVLSLQTRYDRAITLQKNSARYTLRLRLCTIEGIRDVVHRYATFLADVLDELRRQAGMIIINDDSDLELDDSDDGSDNDSDSDF